MARLRFPGSSCGAPEALLRSKHRCQNALHFCTLEEQTALRAAACEPNRWHRTSFLGTWSGWYQTLIRLPNNERNSHVERRLA